MKATKPEFRMVLRGARCPAALARQLSGGGGGPVGSTSLPLTAAEAHVKKLGFILALGLTSAAAQAGTLFEIPINGGIARFQLDDNCRESICATLSWSENRGPSSSGAGTSGAAAEPAAPAPEPPAAVARLAPQEPLLRPAVPRRQGRQANGWSRTATPASKSPSAAEICAASSPRQKMPVIQIATILILSCVNAPLSACLSFLT